MKKVVRGYKRQFWRGVVAILAATYGVVLVLAAPTYAADGISLTVDSQNVELVKQKPTSDLYKKQNTLTVDMNQPNDFVLTIHATSADLVNDQNSNYRIEGISAFKDESSGQELLMGINPNGWGYRVEEGPGAADNPDKFLHTPAGTEKPSVIVDTASEYDNAGCKGKKQCTVHVTFGASLDLTKLPAGKYSTDVTYEVVAKQPDTPKPKSDDWPQRTAKANPSETCEAGNTNSSCLVTLDRNMIPVKYTGTTTNAQWTSVADPEATNSGWYDYSNKQWANAITVKPEALSKYRGFNKVVDQSDILGFWVYIPRYRYKVLRFSGSDPAVSAQNFTIEFENKQSTKTIPTANGTWATHPAFTFGSKELNGIWFAKFETTGTNTQPTVLPNEAHMSGSYTESHYIGRMYTTAKTLGVVDSSNIGGNTDYSIPTQNNHHLATLSSHMVNNNDWGAATYLYASKYGAGYNGVQINASSANHDGSYGTTGCGPQANGNTSSYNNSGTLGTPQACGSTDRAYNGTLGQLASTTNNPTGIYDMSGGGWEYTASSYTSDLNNSSTSYFSQSAHPPYVNTYNFKDFNSCTYRTCGGQALYETNNGSQWNNQSTSFVYSSSPWFERGGYYGDGSNAGLFRAGDDNGYANGNRAFRVALAPTTQD